MMDSGIVEVPPPQPVGIYGWRKRCLYTFLVLLMVVVVINLALTVWILRVLDFSIDGMGRLRIVPKGIRLEGEAEFLRPLYVQGIKADEGKVMHLESARSIKMQSRTKDSKKSGSLLLGNNKLQAACDAFQILDNQGNLRMSIAKDEIVVGGDEIKFLGKAQFEGSVQTPSLFGPNSKPLKVTSENSKVEISGAGGVSLTSSDGDVELTSADNVRILSTGGSIFLESQDIIMKNIAVSQANDGGQSYPDVYQLCMCTSGRVFLGAASGDCRATEDICRTS
ncbi:zeta-sarcoglycan-like [Littorina saxatilis]|uniref:zeta-sarcoglycan-like n=1 Tax=Littorina saxatilis TaxID=31220 RepID=UPI0038B5482A